MMSYDAPVSQIDNKYLIILIFPDDYWLVVWLPFFIFPFSWLAFIIPIDEEKYVSEGWPSHQPDEKNPPISIRSHHSSGGESIFLREVNRAWPHFLRFFVTRFLWITYELSFIYGLIMDWMFNPFI